MKIDVAASGGWRLREPPLPFQKTYATPLSDLPKFVRTILAPFEVTDGAIHIEQIIFKPNELIWYMRRLGIVTDEGQLNRATLQAANKQEALTLLECVLGQWTDFAFLPSPKQFAIYADHDEYTTVFTASVEMLNTLHSDMSREGFKEVDGWTWTGPHSPGIVEGKDIHV